MAQLLILKFTPVRLITYSMEMEKVWEVLLEQEVSLQFQIIVGPSIVLANLTQFVLVSGTQP